MDALEAILTRRVVRQFAPQPVEIEQLRKIVNAGRHAMSARNLQPWQFIVVRNSDHIAGTGGPMHDRTVYRQLPGRHRGPEGHR